MPAMIKEDNIKIGSGFKTENIDIKIRSNPCIDIILHTVECLTPF